MKKENPESLDQEIKFFEDFIRGEKITQKIINLRKEIGIPVDGIPFKKEDWEELEFNDPKSNVSNIPQKLYLILGKTMEERENNSEKLFQSFIHFLKKEKFQSFFMSYLFRNYIIFNKVLPYFETENQKNDLIKLEQFSTKSNQKKTLDAFLKEKNKYPLVISFNPYISQRQFKDFLSRNWTLIEKHRDPKYINYNLVRTRNNQKINDLIYKNKHLKTKKITSLVSEKFKKYYDPSTIRKIISIEEKRRNK